MKILPEWIEWKGGKCPVHGDSYVVYELRGGRRGFTEAWRHSWQHDGINSDIIAYAPVDIDIEPYKPQPKWTVEDPDSSNGMCRLFYVGQPQGMLMSHKVATAIADALNAAGVEI